MFNRLNVCGAPAATPVTSAKYGLAFRVPTFEQSTGVGALSEVTGVYGHGLTLMSTAPVASCGICTSRASVHITRAELGELAQFQGELCSNVTAGAICR